MVEWNQVTWYSKALAACVFFGVFTTAFFLGVETEQLRMEFGKVSIVNLPLGSATDDVEKNIISNKEGGPNEMGFSLIEYPIWESPVATKSTMKDCSDGNEETDPLSKESGKIDIRLVNDNRLILPSILEAIAKYEKVAMRCDWDVQIFSVPYEGKYVYVQIWTAWGAVYRIDTSDSSITKLSIGEMLWLAGGYQLVDDGKQVVLWDAKEVGISNLEADTHQVLYTASSGQTLLSKTSWGKYAETDYEYDVKIADRNIEVGIHDAKMTNDGRRVTIDENGNVGEDPEGKPWDGRYRLVKRIMLPLPE